MTAAPAPCLADDPIARLDPADPHPIYAELRAGAPAHWSRRLNSWVLTRYDDVRGVLDHADFRVPDPASRLSRLAARGGPRLANLIASYGCLTDLVDPDRSLGAKRVFFQLMTSWRQLGLKERLAKRAAELLAAGAAAGRIDLAAGYGRKLTVFASWSLFGIAESAHGSLDTSAGVSALLSGVVHPLRELVRLEAEAGLFVDRFRAAIAQRRRATADDGLSRMARAADAELDWTDDQLAGFCAFILGASREATSAGVSGCCQKLLEDAELRARLRRDPARRPAAVRELLRLVSPFQYVSRTAIRDTEIAGQAIRAGQTVRAMVAAANRDPAAFPDPDAVDLERQGPEPLTFSAGAFRCLGEQLAQMELGVALDAILDCPGLRLGPEPATWGTATHIRELRHVPAIFVGGEAAGG